MAATALSRRTRRSVVRRPVLGADDHRLVARVRAGDDTAFEAIYDRYARGLLAFCSQMLTSRDEAEDALQHSFGAAYRMLRSSDQEVELRPWLYTIARNRCLSVLRARRQHISLDGAPDYGGIADGLADEVQRRSDLRELLEDLRRLPPDQREALVLVEFAGLPHDEIAAVLNVRREKVKALVFQAREGLIRARRARELPCTEMREQLATLAGHVPTRGMLRRHVDRCPNCALFEAEVGRQRAGLALIFPVLPTLGLKSIVLGSVLGRGAAVAGAGGAGGAAVLGGVTGGGGGLACAGAGGGAAGLAGGAGAGAAAGGGVLAGAAAGGVGGTLATAGGAGTIAAALGAQGASAAVAKLLVVAVVAAGGGAAGTGDIGSTFVEGVAPASAVQQDGTYAGAASPVAQQPLVAPGRPGSATAVDLASGATPTPVHDPPPVVAPDQPLLPAVTPQPATSPSATPAVLTGGLPASGGVSPVPTDATATAQPPAAAEPDPTSVTPAVTAAPATPSVTPASATPSVTPASAKPAGTTTTAAAPVPGASPTTQTTTTADAPDAAKGAPATSGTPAAGTPAAGSEPAAGGAPAAGATTPAHDASRHGHGTPPQEPAPEAVGTTVAEAPAAP